MAITNLTNYQWYGNTEINIPSTETVYNIDLVYVSFREFTNSAPIRYNNEYSQFILNYTSQNVFAVLYKNSTAICPAYMGDGHTGAWDTERRLIIIKGGVDATNSTLISWLQANGTLTPAKVETPTITATQDGFVLSNISEYCGKIDVFKDGQFLERINPYTTFNISYNLEHCTIERQQDTITNRSWDNAYMKIIPDDGYKIPSTISVVGASYVLEINGEIVLSNAISDVTVSITCEEAQPYILIVDVEGAFVDVTYMDGTQETISYPCVIENVKSIDSVDYEYEEEQDWGVWDKDGELVTTTLPMVLDADYYTIYAQSEYVPAICFVEGTPITLEDGTTKKVEDIIYDDKLLVWDFYSGCQRSISPLWILPHKYHASFYSKITLSDGTVLNLTGSEKGVVHRLYNVEQNAFIYPNEFKKGEHTINKNGDLLTIKSMRSFDKTVNYYNIITDTFYNVYANGILSSCRLSNRYGIKDMKYDLTDVRMTQEEVDAYLEEHYKL